MGKRLLAPLLALALTLTASACSGGRVQDGVAEDIPSAPAETPSEAPLPDRDSGPYGEVLAKYRSALSEKWGGERLLEEDISLLCAEAEAGSVGYCLLDVDGDGGDELLIGAGSGQAYPEGMIFDMYAAADGAVTHVFSGQARDRWYLYADEAAEGVYFFYRESSSSAFESSYMSMSLAGGKLEANQALLYNAQADGGPWFSGVVADGAATASAPMEEKLAESIIASYRAIVAAPLLTPLAG